MLLKGIGFVDLDVVLWGVLSFAAPVCLAFVLPVLIVLFARRPTVRQRAGVQLRFHLLQLPTAMFLVPPREAWLRWRG